VLVGPHSSSPPWLEAERQTILAKAWSDSRKSVIPILFGDGDSPAFLRSWVPLRVDPDAEPAKWTSRVLDALRSQRKPAALSAADRRKREERLREMGRAAEERKRTESGVRAPLEESLTAPSQEAPSYFSIQLIQYSIHSTLSPAGSTSIGLSPSSITALSSVNAFFP